MRKKRITIGMLSMMMAVSMTIPVSVVEKTLLKTKESCVSITLGSV